MKIYHFNKKEMNKQNLLVSIIAFLVIFLYSCSSDDVKESEIQKDTLIHTKEKDTHITEKASDSSSSKTDKKVNTVYKTYKFICPIGDIKGNSNTPGICPECQMELIENPDYSSESEKKK